MNPRKLFTFVIGAAIFIGRAVKYERTSPDSAAHALDDGAVFFAAAEAKGLAPTEDELG